MASELDQVLEAIKDGFASLKSNVAPQLTPPGVVAPVVTPVVAPVAPAALSYGALASGGATVSSPSSAEKELSLLKRKMRLEELAKTKKVNVDVELAEWADQSDASFEKHASSIAACYATINAGGATVTPLDAPNGGRPTADRIKQVQMNAIARGENMNYESVAARLLTDPTWDGNR